MGLQHLQQKQLYNKSSNGDTFKVGDMSIGVEFHLSPGGGGGGGGGRL